ncbi:XdhC family protein [Streptomyces sp. WMMC897]|uniref:XdhC family protein n=1 Tax=Streptomyces sp. WMMC897 TaxID=3014782 RepID=UPI0022B69889|nr:XdhC/CoxI family protein [Streptomyces sp. WMMC897]MCZ7415912.1 XdhC family protein [Streptomyces sp. WMMC897]
MLDIADELNRWCEQGRDFAVATVVATHGSSPRQPGAAMAVDGGGTVIGSVSGGCVEGAVYELCQTALTTGESVVERFGYSDEDAFAVGLTCGGVIDILVTPIRAATGRAAGGMDEPAVRPAVAPALAAAARGDAAAVVRVVAGPAGLLGRLLYVRPDGTHAGALNRPADVTEPTALERSAVAEALGHLAIGRTATVEIGEDGSRCGEPVTLLVESSVPPPRMLVFGAIDFASALVRIGKFLGHHVTLCDARPVFATARRFPEADEIVVDWPHRYLDTQRLDGRAVLCVLTHDAKFDVPLLERALRLPVAYVGAMGSRRTHESRLAKLRDVGLGEEELARLRSPIGLDLGGRTPEETALSIAAEIVAARHGASGAPLTGGGIPIHGHRVPAPAPGA